LLMRTCVRGDTARQFDKMRCSKMVKKSPIAFLTPLEASA
jgi:hypothetical protein